MSRCVCLAVGEILNPPSDIGDGTLAVLLFLVLKYLTLTLPVSLNFAGIRTRQGVVSDLKGVGFYRNSLEISRLSKFAGWLPR